MAATTSKVSRLVTQLTSLNPNETFINRAKRRHGHRFTLYPLANLQELIKAINTHRRKIGKSVGVKDLTIRYVVDTNCNLWLAREGEPGEGVPGHGQMCLSCLAAGNMTVSPAGEIIAINHKSGDFRPSFQSLVWPLRILTQQKNLKLLNRHVTLEQLTSSGGEKDSIRLSKRELSKLITQLTKTLSSSNSSRKRSKNDGLSIGERLIACEDQPQENYLDTSSPRHCSKSRSRSRRALPTFYISAPQSPTSSDVAPTAPFSQFFSEETRALEVIAGLDDFDGDIPLLGYPLGEEGDSDAPSKSVKRLFF